MKNFSGMKLFFGIVAILFIGILLKFYFSGNATPSEKERVAAQKNLPNIESQVASEGWVAGNGVVEPKGQESKLAASVSGIVQEIKVNEGDFVKAGQVLLRLDSSREKALLESAQADVLIAQAELKRVLKGLRKEDVATVLAEHQAALAKSESSTSTFQRLAKISDSGGVSAEELEKAEKLAATDKANLAAVQARKNSALSGSRSEDIEIAHARVKLSEAGKIKAQADLAKTELFAPYDGQVLQVKVRVGEFTNPTTSEAIVYGDTSQLRARIDIDERNISQLAIGNEGYVSLSAFPDKKFSGKVIEIGRRMGRKNIRTDDPVERIDTKILEVVVELSEPANLIPGVRVLGFIQQKK
jgi:HlyD family secretion protein